MVLSIWSQDAYHLGETGDEALNAWVVKPLVVSQECTSCQSLQKFVLHLKKQNYRTRIQVSVTSKAVFFTLSTGL